MIRRSLGRIPAALGLAAVVAAASAASSVCAASIPIVNGSFEEPAGAKLVGDATWSNIPGWTSTGPSADSGLELFNPNPQPDLGANIAFLQSGDGSIFQDTTHVVSPADKAYQISFYERNDWQATELTFVLYTTGGGSFYQQTVPTTSSSRPDMVQHTFVTPYPANGSGVLGVRFENTSLAGQTGSWAWVDGIQISTIPEPASGIIAAIAGLVIGCGRRRSNS